MCKTTSTFANQNSFGCGCTGGYGLAGASEQENTQATKTKDDVIQTAKDYINDEIPTKYKIGAGVLLAGAFWWRSRCK